jgi:hypothetical protein
MARDQLAQDIGLPSTADLPVLSIDEKAYVNEKVADSSDEVIDKIELVGDKGSSLENAYEGQKDGVTYVNGEPVISSGADVSNFLLDVRDDGDPSITFRSLFLGTIFAALGAALSQVRLWLWHEILITSNQSSLDLYFQASPSRRLYNFLTVAHICDRQRLGVRPPSLVMGRRNSIFSPRACAACDQPRSLQA